MLSPDTALFGHPRKAVRWPPRTIRRWRASGHLTGQKLGCILVVDEAAIAELGLRAG